MPRPKKSKILPDKENIAIRTAEMFKLQKGSFALVHFSAKEVEGISDGIFSLVAERDRLQALAAAAAAAVAPPAGWRLLANGEVRGDDDMYLTDDPWRRCVVSIGRKQGSEKAKEPCIRRVESGRAQKSPLPPPSAE